MVPEKFSYQGYVGNFIVNLFGISIILILPFSLYFASKLFIELYNTQLRDLNDSKFKIVMKYILKLSKRYNGNF